MYMRHIQVALCIEHTNAKTCRRFDHITNAQQQQHPHQHHVRSDHRTKQPIKPTPRRQYNCLQSNPLQDYNRHTIDNNCQLPSTHERSSTLPTNNKSPAPRIAKSHHIQQPAHCNADMKRTKTTPSPHLQLQPPFPPFDPPTTTHTHPRTPLSLHPLLI